MSEDQSPAPTRVDVSNEVVERLAQWHQARVTLQPWIIKEPEPQDAAATLRALAAQRDELLSAGERMVAAQHAFETLAKRAGPVSGDEKRAVLDEFEAAHDAMDAAIARAVAVLAGLSRHKSSKERMTMTDEWKPQKGDVAWVRGEVFEVDPGAEMPVRVDFGDGKLWLDKARSIRPDAPAPAAMDGVAVLRRAAEIMDREGAVGCDLPLRLAQHLEAARRAPTPLEALKDVITAYCGIDGVSMTKAVEAARRAIAVAEAKGGV